MADLRPNPSVLEISPYVGGRASVPGVAKVHKLSANETPLGPSPKAIAAFRSAAETLQDYPDGGSSVLREAIASVHGLDPNRILCGNGSDELLHLIAQAYCAPGDEAIFSAHAFLVYRIATLAAGGHPIVVPEPDRVVEVDRLLAAVSSRTRIVFLANPNNPTGTYLPESELRRLHAGLPPSVLLVIDAAYAEYVGRNDYEAGTALVAGAQNVIMTRTFSKVYGLAALRIGWLTAAPAIIDALNRVRGPFNVSTPAQLAGAAAMRDQAFVEEAVRYNREWLGYLSREISALGLAVDPSVGNFLLIHFPDEDGRRAADADRFLSARGLILRATANYGLPNALRLSVGTAEANTLVVEALRDFLAPKR